ncbi:MAG: NUDIX domain-containing protein [bacterium]|nr:NUDIX domain-containing protein [bacterium]
MPENNTIKPGDIVVVRGIITDYAGRLLLVMRNEHCKNNPGQWEVPGGQLSDFKESFADCIARETREETGLEVQLAKGKFETVEVRDKHEGDGAGRYHALAGLMSIIGCEEVNLSKSDEHSHSMWLPKHQYPRVMLTVTTKKALSHFCFF